MKNDDRYEIYISNWYSGGFMRYDICEYRVSWANLMFDRIEIKFTINKYKKESFILSKK